jgi:hypothetical protein
MKKNLSVSSAHSAVAVWCLLALGGVAIATSVFAEPRTFTSTEGREIVAEVISHDGKGSFQLKRADGNEFTVSATALSLEDQKFLQEWAAANPPKVDYRFDFKVAAEKVVGNRSRQLGGYKNVKNELWTYRVDMTNLSRDVVSGLTIEYRVFKINAADGQFRASDGITEGFIGGTASLDKELRFNETFQFTTGEVQIDEVSYRWSSMRNERYKDALRGVMIRIKDAAGNVVWDFVSSHSPMTGKTWDSVPASREIKQSD